MGRLIEVQDAQSCQSPLTLQVGDVLLFYATGGRAESRCSILEVLGSLLQATIGDDGNILTPQGAPNRVLFRAIHPGQAVIHLITGDPWSGSQEISLDIDVGP